MNLKQLIQEETEAVFAEAEKESKGKEETETEKKAKEHQKLRIFYNYLNILEKGIERAKEERMSKEAKLRLVRDMKAAHEWIGDNYPEYVPHKECIKYRMRLGKKGGRPTEDV
jgi:hypothetical protein